MAVYNTWKLASRQATQIFMHIMLQKLTDKKHAQSTSWSLPEDDSESLAAAAGCDGCFAAFFLCANNFNSYNN